ncbi:MAG: cytidylate kinase family protein, partial [Anaerovoracaceae bacterium]
MRTCICINREYGVNGGVIAEAVEKSTGLPVFDSELRDMAVSGAGIDREALDLNESKKLNTWLEEHFYGENTDYNVISVFASAPLGRRVRTVMAREDMNELMAKLRIRKIDSLRRDLFRYYVSDDDEQEKGSWGHADAYDLCF